MKRLLQALKRALGGFNQYMESTASTEESIRKGVQRRKERAEKLGIITSAFKLYVDALRYCDAGSGSRPCPAIRVTKRTKEKTSYKSIERVEATVQGYPYAFTFRERMPDEMDHRFAELDVDFQDRRVMTVCCSAHDEPFSKGPWRPLDVSAFIDGPWVKPLNSAYAEFAALREVREKQQRDQATRKELEKLKKDFGL